MRLDELVAHLDRGGAATLNHPAIYPVSEGAVIAPARYAGNGNNGSEFVFERRAIAGAFVPTVLIDSKSSQANRAEEGLVSARQDGEPAALIPTIAVRYPSMTLLDLELPHRAVDAHVRASSESGTPTVKQPWYQALRDAGAADLSPVFTVAPSMLAFGGWDSTRSRGQLRLRSLFVSELFGVVDDSPDRLSRRAGARIDPLGQQIELEADDAEELISRFSEHLSEKKRKALENEVAKARKSGKRIKASPFLLGGVPPQTGDRAPAFGVSVSEVRRVRTISLAGLRRLRFGGTNEEDIAARTALLGMILLGAAYADADPDIRAYCDLGAPKGRVLLDDEEVDLDLSIESCTVFLAEAIERLPERLAWTGQQRVLDGAPALESGATDVDDEEE
jgi:CRISPR-associated protein Csb1